MIKAKLIKDALYPTLTSGECEGVKWKSDCL
ncbi:Protein of unknown function [Bacillus mobilis]|nr:Protein of unknown function [Bacillus mobilis]